MNFFQGLSEEARMRPFSLAWLEKRLSQRLNPDPQIFDDVFLKRIQRILHRLSN
jgi:hypothetical protein